MRRLLIAFAFTCTFSVSVLAGQIPTVGAPEPPPGQANAATVPGDIASGGAADQLSSDALSALLTALSFLAV